MIRQTLLAELQFEAGNTRKLFDAIPDEVLEYKPNDFNWTIAQLASHTAEVYKWWEMTLLMDVFELDNYQNEKGDISNMESIKRTLDDNIARAIACLEDYPDEKFAKMWSMTSGGVELMPPMPRIQVVRNFLMNHLYHHRGELVAYLRANGCPVPGLYGPSYEEQQAMQNS